MEMAGDSIRRRSRWIWAIVIFYAISAGWMLLSFFLIYSGIIPINPEQRTYLDSLSPFDLIITLLIALLNLSGAVVLFLLNRLAFKLFVTAFAASVLMALWHAATKGWLQALGDAGLIGTMIGYGISATVCIYSWKLTKRGILT